MWQNKNSQSHFCDNFVSIDTNHINIHVYIYTFIGVHNHHKGKFFIMWPTKKEETEKQNERKHNEATKTFQRKVIVEDVNEY